MERKQWETEFLPIEVQVTKHHEEEGEPALLPIGEVLKVNQEEEGDKTGFLQVENHEEETHIVNLADFIGVGVWGNRDRNCKEFRQYLPNHFNINTHSLRREQSIPFIAKACAQSGFKVSTKGWEKPWQKIRFFCQHSRAHHDDSKRASAALPSPHSASMLLESTDEMKLPAMTLTMWCKTKTPLHV